MTGEERLHSVARGGDSTGVRPGVRPEAVGVQCEKHIKNTLSIPGTFRYFIQLPNFHIICRVHDVFSILWKKKLRF